MTTTTATPWPTLAELRDEAMGRLEGAAHALDQVDVRLCDREKRGSPPGYNREHRRARGVHRALRNGRSSHQGRNHSRTRSAPHYVRLSDLRAGEIAAWEAGLPPRFRYAVVRALRQVLDAAVGWEYLARNLAKATGKNPAPVVVERIALEPADVDRLATELRSPFGAAAVVGAWCYLRPSELLALERGDVDGDVLHVRRTLDGEGGTKASGKTRRSLRAVPLPLRARQALAELPPRLDTRLLFPSPAGTLYDACNFRRREFVWAREAAGLSGECHELAGLPSALEPKALH